MSENTFINVLHSDKWQVVFSNLPGDDNSNHYKYFENYVRSFDIPGYNMATTDSIYPGGYKLRHPVTKPNVDLQNVSMGFVLSEDFMNYFIMWSWMNHIKYGDADTSEAIRKYYIKSININVLDNEKRTVGEVKFTNCFMTSLSDLQLTQGTSDNMQFTATFSYEEVEINLKSIFIENT